MNKVNKHKMTNEEKIIIIIIIRFICGEGFVEALHYGDKSFPTYRMGRICKIVGKDSFAFWGRICGEG